MLSGVPAPGFCLSGASDRGAEAPSRPRSQRPFSFVVCKMGQLQQTCVLWQGGVAPVGSSHRSWPLPHAVPFPLPAPER